MNFITETKKASIEEFKMSQNFRLLDAFVFAPSVFYFGMNKELHPLLRAYLIASAGFIFFTNGKRYLENKKIHQEYLKSGETGQIDEVQKTNNVRIENIFLFSPLMIYVGTKYKNEFMRYLIISLASASVFYNGYHLIKSKNE